MWCLGLTGGIGAGKSTAARFFAELGVPVIDADDIARELTEREGPVLDAIRARWGDCCFDARDQLDRRRLREVVFAAPEALAELEAIVHPAVIAEIEARKAALARRGVPYCVVVIPLLFEKDLRHLVDEVAVIDLPEELQLARAAARDDSDAEAIRAIMAHQLPRRERLRRADIVFDNRGSPENLRAQIENLHKRLTIA